ncbi:hypothetical protein EE612_033279, partial [Oryza sativa]
PPCPVRHVPHLCASAATAAEGHGYGDGGGLRGGRGGASGGGDSERRECGRCQGGATCRRPVSRRTGCGCGGAGHSWMLGGRSSPTTRGSRPGRTST